ncbi:MAG: outer membrane lipoprotein carrier protein LolA [Flavobacteriales bacterium]|nr:outer membrane lipoprotein carrier protein LolA [Flavobacteriales bacterium]
MKSLIILLLTVATSFSALAQQDQKAKAILDKLSAKTKAYKTIKAEFKFTITNKSEGINESQTGKIQIKGNKYFLSIAGQDVVSDGKDIYTVLKDAEEIQINNLPDEDEEEFISPNKIFTLYESGFKYKYIKEVNGVQIINLYPNDAEDKEYHRIALYINKAKGQISKVKVYGKDGSISTYSIKTFTANSTIADLKFTVDIKKYKSLGYEIVDLRD